MESPQGTRNSKMPPRQPVSARCPASAPVSCPVRQDGVPGPAPALLGSHTSLSRFYLLPFCPSKHLLCPTQGLRKF